MTVHAGVGMAEVFWGPFSDVSGLNNPGGSVQRSENQRKRHKIRCETCLLIEKQHLSALKEPQPLLNLLSTHLSSLPLFAECNPLIRT